MKDKLSALLSTASNSEDTVVINLESNSPGSRFANTETPTESAEFVQPETAIDENHHINQSTNRLHSEISSIRKDLDDLRNFVNLHVNSSSSNQTHDDDYATLLQERNSLAPILMLRKSKYKIYKMKEIAF